MMLRLTMALMLALPAFGGYTYSRTISVDHTKVLNTNQTNFNVLISGTYAFLAVVGSGGEVQSGSGYDVAFGTDIACTSLLNWEQETWTSTTGLVNYRVKVASVSHTVDTVFYVCTGNSGIVSFQGGAQGSAWTSAARIHHFSDGSTLSGVDASTNNQMLTINAATAVAGQIDGAAGTDNAKYLHDGGGSIGYPSPPLTFSGWFKTVQAVSAPFATFGRDTGSNQCALYMDGGTGHVAIFNGGSGATTTSAVNDGTWHYIAGVADNSSGANNTHIYRDGVLEATATVLWNISILSATDNLTVGRLGGGSQPMTASQDDLQIYGIAQTADWVATTYNSQLSPSTFYSVGPQVVISGSSVRHRVIQ